MFEVLVKVEAAAMNPQCVYYSYKRLRSLVALIPYFDASGYLTMKIPNLVVKRPRTAEMDFTGTVVDPNGVEGFSAGDKVSGLVGMRDSNDTQGSLCQYIAVLTEEVIHKPSRLSLEEAAGFTACALTAYKALFDILKVEPGQTIFVNGGKRKTRINIRHALKTPSGHTKAAPPSAACSSKKRRPTDVLFIPHALPRTSL